MLELLMHTAVAQAAPETELRCPGAGAEMPSSGVPWWSRSSIDVPLAAPIYPPTPDVDATLASRFAVDPTTTRRIVVWGDSHLASGGMLDGIERAFAQRGVQVASAFVAPYLTLRGVRLPVRAHCVGGAWQVERAYTAKTPVAFGPALLAMQARATPRESYIWLDLRTRAGAADVFRARLHVQALQSNTEIAVSLNQGGERRFVIAPEPDAYVDLQLPLSLLEQIRWRVTRGTVSFHGVGLTRVARPAVTIDVFAIPGATIAGLGNSDMQTFAGYLGPQAVDAVWLEYGTNEAANSFEAPAYEAQLTRVLSGLRLVYPDAACLLIGPPDRGLSAKDRGDTRHPGISLDDPRHNARVHERVNAIQARIAPAFNCSHWNWQAYMGGVGAQARWAQLSPSGMARDQLHLSQSGYRQSGFALAALLGWSNPG